MKAQLSEDHQTGSSLGGTLKHGSIETLVFHQQLGEANDVCPPMYVKVKASTSRAAYCDGIRCNANFISSIKKYHGRDAPLKQDMVDLMEVD